MQHIENKKCPWCGLYNSVKFPCCGFLCMCCGKTYEEEDTDANSNSTKKPD